jgi:hypothetical protein
MDALHEDRAAIDARVAASVVLAVNEHRVPEGRCAVDQIEVLLEELRAALLPNRAVAHLPPIWRSPSVRIQAMGPSAYSCPAIDPEVSMIGPTCGCWIGALTCRVARHGWVVIGLPVACWARPRV